MKKNIAAEDRPDFTLMKLSGAISYFHMQMPRWLFCDPRYMDMGLESKVAYTFLLNRYQLSRRNGSEMAVLEEDNETPDTAEPAVEQPDMPEGQLDTDKNTSERPAEIAVLDMPNPQVLTCQNGSSRSAETAVLDLQKPHTSKKEKSKKEYRDTDDELPTVPRAGAEDGRGAIAAILQRCALSRYAPEEATVFRDAVSWLYYCGRLQLGACTYPRGYVRDTLRRLNADVLDEALYRLRRNENEALSNTLVYTAKVIFSTIVEMGSEALLDPVVNRVKRRLAI
ncbi:Replication initiator protein A (RepA) N-terminus [uncultured Butyricicoccus sp.]|uniref:Uncharacterized protein n=1 Tax=Agathobaculum ammoniilyticum TaxID=2981778 RepID=A0ABT2U720_9FIRM|nr:hypothetical protein [Agathobaculum ammoniilyticum]MCU6790418.1 hypothetical protein [Agathobaculum ammoniilyticum]SCJ61733.1 Replication initiator protein A (RepA) N-terminus [uncultured Butyricicoccus sp.]